MRKQTLALDESECRKLDGSTVGRVRKNPRFQKRISSARLISSKILSLPHSFLSEASKRKIENKGNSLPLL